MTAGEVIARAACRSRCEGRAHVCDQDQHGACLPEKCSLWDVLWLDLVNDALAALRAAGFAVVPREATDAMVDAAIDRSAAYDGATIYHGVYHAMVAAAEGGE